MTKYVEIQELIPVIANNFETHFNVEKKNISSNIVSLLDGIVNQATIRKHLPSSMKKWKEKTNCSVCGKRINANPHSVSLHMRLKHEQQKKGI